MPHYLFFTLDTKYNNIMSIRPRAPKTIMPRTLWLMPAYNTLRLMCVVYWHSCIKMKSYRRQNIYLGTKIVFVQQMFILLFIFPFFWYSFIFFFFFDSCFNMLLVTYYLHLPWYIYFLWTMQTRICAKWF